MLPILLEEWNDPAERWFDLILMLLIMLVLIIILLFFIQSFRQRIWITKDSITYLSGKKIIKTIPKDQIIAYGCFSSNERLIPGVPFFCYATPKEVSAIAEKHWHWIKRIYPKKHLEELEKTAEGLWVLQMSIYICYESRSIPRKRKSISLNYITKDALHAIEDLWQRKPMLLGTMPIYYPWRYQ